MEAFDKSSCQQRPQWGRVSEVILSASARLYDTLNGELRPCFIVAFSEIFRAPVMHHSPKMKGFVRSEVP
jgi:hypothetical protein